VEKTLSPDLAVAPAEGHHTGVVIPKHVRIRCFVINEKTQRVPRQKSRWKEKEKENGTGKGKVDSRE